MGLVTWVREVSDDPSLKFEHFLQIITWNKIHLGFKYHYIFLPNMPENLSYYNTYSTRNQFCGKKIDSVIVLPNWNVTLTCIYPHIYELIYSSPYSFKFVSIALFGMDISHLPLPENLILRARELSRAEESVVPWGLQLETKMVKIALMVYKHLPLVQACSEFHHMCRIYFWFFPLYISLFSTMST